MDKSTNSEMSAQFLLAEFNALQERARSYEEIKSSRVNYFLVVVAATGAIFSALSQANLLGKFVSETFFIVALLLWFLGIFTLQGLIDYSVAIIVFYRRAGRIRRWFVNEDQSLDRFVAFEASDDRPNFIVGGRLLHWRGGESVLMLLNCSMVAIMLFIICSYIPYLQGTISIILIIIAGISFWFFQCQYIHNKMKEAQHSNWANKNIYFPGENRDVSMYSKQEEKREE